MSGLVALFHASGAPVAGGVVEHALDAIRHRGPHGLVAWRSGPVGMGHAALHTTPESALGRQPVVDTGRGLTVVADVRLDNRDVLIDRLDLHSVPPSQTTDAALILAAYRRWGLGVPEHLLGAFAAAIWDAPKRRLVVVRDPIGVKPLYVAEQSGTVAVASEIKALLALGVATDAVDPARVAAYLTRSFGEGTETTYRDVRRIRPAQVAWWESGRPMASRTYWQLNPEAAAPPRTEAEYADGFREIFDEAMRCRLRAPDPVGAHVSGGLDSTSVAAAARDVLADSYRPPLHTYSAVFSGHRGTAQRIIDESAFVDAFDRQGGTRGRRIDLGAASAFDGLRGIISGADQPSFTYNAYMMWHLLQAAREDGVRVVLDGIEGDVAVSHGNGYFIELAAQGRWQDLCTRLSRYEAVHDFTASSMVDTYGPTMLGLHAMHHHWREVLRGARALGNHGGASPARLTWRYALKPHLPDSLQHAWNWFRGVAAPASAAERLLSPNLRALVPEPADEPPLRTERAIHAAGIVHPGVATFLEEGDHYAAAHGVEPRHPFYDVRLIEYCVALPPEMKMRDGWTRYVLREAMRDTLPETVRTRPSKGILTPNFHRGVVQHGAQTLDHMLFEPEAQARLSPFLNLSELETARRSGDAHRLWTAVQLSAWLRERNARACTTARPAAAPSSTAESRDVEITHHHPTHIF